MLFDEVHVPFSSIYFRVMEYPKNLHRGEPITNLMMNYMKVNHSFWGFGDTPQCQSEKNQIGNDFCRKPHPLHIYIYIFIYIYIYMYVYLF